MKGIKFLFVATLFISLTIGSSAQEMETKAAGTVDGENSKKSAEIKKAPKPVTNKEKLTAKTAEVFDKEPKIVLNPKTEDFSHNRLFVRPPAKKSTKPPKSQNVDDEYHKGEFYVGFSGALAVDDEVGFEGGVNVSGVYYFTRYVGAKGDFSGTFQDISGGTHSLYNVTGGVQFKDSLKSKKIKPFAHALVGFSRHKDVYDFAPRGGNREKGLSTIFGGGLDIKVSDNIDIRAFQLDINPIFFQRDRTGFRRTYLNFRYGAGVVFNF